MPENIETIENNYFKNLNQEEIELVSPERYQILVKKIDEYTNIKSDGKTGVQKKFHNVVSKLRTAKDDTIYYSEITVEFTKANDDLSFKFENDGEKIHFIFGFCDPNFSILNEWNILYDTCIKKIKSPTKSFDIVKRMLNGKYGKLDIIKIVTAEKKLAETIPNLVNEDSEKRGI